MRNDQADFKQWAADLATVGAEVTAFAQKKTYNEDAVIESLERRLAGEPSTRLTTVSAA